MQINKILKIHSKWLWANGYKTEAKSCIIQANRKNDFRDKQGKTFKVRNKKGQFIKLKRSSVQVKPRASLCTATYEAVSNRGGVEPLLSWEYVHGNQEG